MPLRRLIATPRVIERDSFRVALDDGGELEIQRVRDPRARRIRLSVDERGARLCLPLRASAISGECFVREHLDWLRAQLDRHGGTDGHPPLRPEASTHLPLRGRELPLRWRAGRYTRLALAADGAAIDAQWTARATPAALPRAARDFYEAQARADIGRWLPAYLPGLPRAPACVRLKRMSSQWGSLSPDGALALDLSLVLAPPPAFEYVLVHELCHLLQHNHSPAFWAEVEARFPHWRAQRDWFHAEGRRLKARLRALVGG
ncbi:MAG: SprT family zinc-dependent metalloprotease [Pseudoxanthomonas sp.]